jgi:hypothetical protein
MVSIILYNWRAISYRCSKESRQGKQERVREEAVRWLWDHAPVVAERAGAGDACNVGWRLAQQRNLIGSTT